MSDIPSNAPQLFFVVLDGIKTLPLYYLRGITLEEIKPFTQGLIRPEFSDPNYSVEPYERTPEWLNRIGHNFKDAVELVNEWHNHRNNFAYYVQFYDDTEGKKAKMFYDHTALISALCDTRFQIDTKDLWNVFDSLLHFAAIHTNYRSDSSREQQYEQYAKKLEKTHQETALAAQASGRLIQRIRLTIESKSAIWTTLAPLHHTPLLAKEKGKIKVFFSYSHRDEALRNKLEDHLSVLKRNGEIESWHDRKIGAGEEWKGSIDSNLVSADIVLLLITSSFLSSDYCYDVEMKSALKRHDLGTAEVVPVILKACDWANSPFSKLLALPTDGKAVASWSNRDEAFTDIARGLRKIIEKMTKSSV